VEPGESPGKDYNVDKHRYGVLVFLDAILDFKNPYTKIQVRQNLYI
jgi:hypothetical protein